MTGMFLTGNIIAGGIAAAPAKYTWRNVTPGAKTMMPIEIHVKNTTKVVGSYSVKVITPENINSKPAEGFESLPSVKWVSLDQKHVVINPGETSKVKLFIEIPNKKEYQDGKWQFYLEVKEDAELGKLFTLACYPRISIITQGAEEKKIELNRIAKKNAKKRLAKPVKVAEQ